MFAGWGGLGGTGGARGRLCAPGCGEATGRRWLTSGDPPADPGVLLAGSPVFQVWEMGCNLAGADLKTLAVPSTNCGRDAVSVVGPTTMVAPPVRSDRGCTRVALRSVG